MSVKHIKLVALVFVIFAIAFTVAKSSRAKEKVSVSSAVVEAGRLSQLKTFSIEQGGKSIRFEQINGQWKVTSIAGYPADHAKVNSFFLKLSSLNSSQRLPAAENKNSLLSLDEKSVSDGSAVKVMLGDETNKQTIYFGSTRKGANGINPLASRGQFARSDAQNSPFLIPEPINISTELISWIQPTIANVLSAKVVRIRQYKGENLGSDNLLYELKAINNELTLVDGIPVGKEYDGINLNLVRGGLENLRLVGIESAEFNSKDQNYQSLFVTEFGIENGLVYEVASLKRGEEYFIKLKVNFERKLRDLYAPVVDAASPEAQEKEEQGPAYESLVKEAEQLNGQYSPWLYKVDSYIAEKFLLSRDSLIQSDS